MLLLNIYYNWPIYNNCLIIELSIKLGHPLFNMAIVLLTCIWNFYFLQIHISHVKCVKIYWAKTEFLFLPFIIRKVWNKLLSLWLLSFPKTMSSHRPHALYTWFTNYEVTCNDWFTTEKSASLIFKLVIWKSMPHVARSKVCTKLWGGL